MAYFSSEDTNTTNIAMCNILVQTKDLVMCKNDKTACSNNEPSPLTTLLKISSNKGFALTNASSLCVTRAALLAIGSNPKVHSSVILPPACLYNAIASSTVGTTLGLSGCTLFVRCATTFGIRSFLPGNKIQKIVVKFLGGIKYAKRFEDIVILQTIHVCAEMNKSGIRLTKQTFNRMCIPCCHYSLNSYFNDIHSNERYTKLHHSIMSVDEKTVFHSYKHFLDRVYNPLVYLGPFAFCRKILKVEFLQLISDVIKPLLQLI